METRGDTGERRQRRRAGFIFGLAVTFLIGRLNNGRGFINTAAPEFIIQSYQIQIDAAYYNIMRFLQLI